MTKYYRKSMLATLGVDRHRHTDAGGNSLQPIIGGYSPANLVLAGADPNKVFRMQERYKKVNGVNDDGTKRKKAKTGNKTTTNNDLSVDVMPNLADIDPSRIHTGAEGVVGANDIMIGSAGRAGARYIKPNGDTYVHYYENGVPANNTNMSDVERTKEVFRRAFARSLSDYENAENAAARSGRYALDNPLETMQRNSEMMNNRYGADWRESSPYGMSSNIGHELYNEIIAPNIYHFFHGYGDEIISDGNKYANVRYGFDPGTTYFMSPDYRKRTMKNHGYTFMGYANDNNKPLWTTFRSTVNAHKQKYGKEIPIYMLGDIGMSRDSLIPVHNYSAEYNMTNAGDILKDFQSPRVSAMDLYNQIYRLIPINHAKSSTINMYKHKDRNEYYMKNSDLNDYGNPRGDVDGGASGKYGKLLTPVANAIDRYGNPFIQTTGYIHIPALDSLKLSSDYIRPK